jgi:nucleotide-binding universal stress UspA family protein
MANTERALVVVGFTDMARRILRHAGEHAQGCNVELVLLAIMPDKEFQDRDRMRLAIPKLDMPYTVGAAEDEGERHAKQLASEVFSDLDVSYDVESRVGRQASLVLDRAAARDCSEIFMAGYRNGPWHNSTFDRVMTEVATEFDGPVTVIINPDPDT